MKRSLLGILVGTFLLTNVQAQLQLQPLWALAPGARSYLNTDNTQRGIAYDPLADRLYLVSRTGGTQIRILNGSSGEDVGTLDVTGVSGGTFALNMIGVAHDGSIYAGNLTIDSAANPYRLYRWSSPLSQPTVVFSGDPSAGDPTATNRRFGDTLDVRGSGTSTEILLASRAGTAVSRLTTDDGDNFVPNVIQLGAGGAAGDAGLGLAFGAGDTFWGTALARNLKQFDFSGTLKNNWDSTVIPQTVANIGIDSANDYFAGISLLGATDELSFYGNVSTSPVLMDTEQFPANNPNANGTGSIDFGAGHLYALDSNNGLMAFTVVPEPSTVALFSLLGVFFFARRFKR